MKALDLITVESEGCIRWTSSIWGNTVVMDKNRASMIRFREHGLETTTFWQWLLPMIWAPSGRSSGCFIHAAQQWYTWSPQANKPSLRCSLYPVSSQTGKVRCGHVKFLYITNPFTGSILRLFILNIRIGITLHNDYHIVKSRCRTIAYTHGDDKQVRETHCKTR